MTKDKADVVLFPKWKTTLEQNGRTALEEKRYKDAIHYFDQLLQFKIETTEVLTGKLVCLMELGRYGEAEDICQHLMKEDEENYYQYLHIYLTILFQTAQYEELIDLLDEIFETEDIPEQVRIQFHQLYDVTKKLTEEEAPYDDTAQLDEFLLSLDQKDLRKQWQLLTKLRKRDVQPYIKQLLPYLEDEEIQPVIKTGLVQWMRDSNVDYEVTVRKFGEVVKVVPSELTDVLSHPRALGIFTLLRPVEDESPSLFELIQQQLFRYLYIRYPNLPTYDHDEAIATALHRIASSSLSMEHLSLSFEAEESEVQKWIDEILAFEREYFTILDS
ncbi:hypothetical protein N781_10405 [Pontibacillus halophilus JSM 076056 = DSM 19796]|uniref:Uncharacterized protein n=1 Tax=Pontibacillus halophilus JSM 076056 = DSM 19796 TaxID=1385510 RepID=A0A0A5ICQ0_9BACI|nr:tetratricopeptide repeat protein [Pontibacillus halophilus]KGX93617.1 hypothetical protein N781_10405 [Pontibacillus halophilus JSM 076056 = DSM 19796]